MFEALIFDLDGTLIDSAPTILESFAGALAAAGLPPQVPLSSDLIGPPLTKTLAKLSGSDDPQLLQSLVEGFKSHYDTQGLFATQAYPGVDSLLEALASRECPLHICTNKRLAPSQTIVQHLGWAGYFSSIYALDMSSPPIADKPSALARQLAERQLDPAHTAYIGDRREDAEAAQANGLTFFYASWGYGAEGRNACPASWHWLESPADLLHHL